MPLRADLIREAIRAYLDEQTDLIGIAGTSRTHFRIASTERQHNPLVSRTADRGNVACFCASAARQSGENEETWLENRILGLLCAQPEGASVRETYRTLRAPRKAVIDALRALESDRTLIRVDTPNKPGPKSETYRLVQY